MIECAISDDPAGSSQGRRGYPHWVQRGAGLAARDCPQHQGCAHRTGKQGAGKTGIKNLKVGFNNVFGYYIEVTRSLLSQVPPEYVRKQTLTGSERYITQELKELEQQILGAKDRILVLENNLFDQLRQQVAVQIHRGGRRRQMPSPGWICTPALPQSPSSKTTADRMLTCRAGSIFRTADIRWWKRC